MEFYSVDQTPSNQRGLLHLYFTEEEAKHLGEAGTRLEIVPNPEDGSTYVLKPGTGSKSKLHRSTSTYGNREWTVSYAHKDGWPITGRTTLKHSNLPDGFLLCPHDSELKLIRNKKTAYPRREPYEKQHLPLDIPGPYKGKQRSKEMVNRAMVGAPAIIQDLKDALEIINDVLNRMDKNVGVKIYVEDLPDASNDLKMVVRATITTKMEL
jgi:hypothetical protein